MEENEKPFGCVAEGCNMRFTNEDHLTVHKKKHDMILNLGNGKMNIFVADQTPTPTRFIRNCEEVGLFQDLQNVNPFEETFRKAVEAGKTGLTLHDVDSLQVPAGGDDTLHTPHVFPFPHMNDEPAHYKSSNLLGHEAAKQKNKYSDDPILRSSSSDCSDVHSAETFNDRSSDPESAVTIRVPEVHSVARQSEQDAVATGAKETVNVAGKSMALYLRMPDGRLVQLVQEPSTAKPVVVAPPIPSPENGLALAKMKLKQALKKNGRIPSSDRETADVEPVAVPSPAAPVPSPAPHRPQPRGGSSYGSGSGEDEGEKKLKFRERNRAAAMRCREKRKTWVQELERRAEDMQTANQRLQSEVTSLRAEVAQLKTLLLAHKNCPITQAMNQAQPAALSAMIPVVTTIHTAPPLKRPPTDAAPPQRSVMVLKRPSKARRTSPAPRRQPATLWHRPNKIASAPAPPPLVRFDGGECKVIKVNPNAIRGPRTTDPQRGPTGDPQRGPTGDPDHAEEGNR